MRDASAPTRAGWPAAVLLALAWGLLPALPALLRGDLLGHPYTDLYPSVWGLHWFAAHQPGLPAFAPELNWPHGTGFYYSSPLHGWAATPLLRFELLSLPATYNLLVLLARVAGPLLAFGWLRAEGLRPAGALAGAALYGCAPMFHGYAVEGIVEGTDAWTLPLWGWLAARRRLVPAAGAFLLVVLSSWYLGLAGLLVAVFRAPDQRTFPISALGGTLLAVPAFLRFSGAFPEAGPLDPAVRAAMGAPLALPTPGFAEGLNPFALTAYVGWVAGALFVAGASRRPILSLGAVVAGILALGRGPWYELPGLEMVRFPYRLLAASLFLGAPVVGGMADRLVASASRRGTRLLAAGAAAAGWAIALEGLVLSPVEPILPGAPAGVPEVYRHVEPTVLLDVPGPVAMPPGVPNLSRPRARLVLYAQAFHGAATPWKPDFNAMSNVVTPSLLSGWQALDPLVGTGCAGTAAQDANLVVLLQETFSTNGIAQVMIRGPELADGCNARLQRALRAVGAHLVAEDGAYRLYRTP